MHEAEDISIASYIIVCVITDTFAGSQSFTEADFNEYYSEFVKCLPMNNPTFLANLYSQGLLSDDMKNKIEDMDTETAKASYFLDHAIKPRLTLTDENLFEKLITLIEDSECEIPNDVNENLRRSPVPVHNKKGKCVLCYLQISFSTHHYML